MPVGGPITFDVEKPWKGDLEEQVVVNGYGEGGSGSGAAAQEGERYLVYARYGGEGEDGPLETSVCDGTKPLAYAEDDLRTLDPKESTLPRAGTCTTGGMWSGTVVVASAALLSLAMVLVFSIRRHLN